MMTPVRVSPCKHLQGKHCTKIGSKCVEKYLFQNNPCLIADKKVHRGAPPPMVSAGAAYE